MPDTANVQDPYRSELLRCLGGIYTIKEICDLNHFLTGHTILACDGLSAIKHTADVMFKTTLKIKI